MSWISNYLVFLQGEGKKKCKIGLTSQTVRCLLIVFNQLIQKIVRIWCIVVISHRYGRYICFIYLADTGKLYYRGKKRLPLLALLRVGYQGHFFENNLWHISIYVYIFQFVDSIPKSAAGKILKKELRDDFQRSAKARTSAVA